MTATVMLGTKKPRKIVVVAQSHARLRHELPKVFSADELQQIADGDDSLGAGIAQITDKAYAALAILSPSLAQVMPLWEWQGYGSADAAATGEYDGDADNAPTVAQIVDAFDAALEENGLKKLGSLLTLGGDMRGLVGEVASRPPANGRT